MRHRVDHRKLGRTASHRKALMRSMVTSLFDAERITTTAPKAKEARRVAERLITRAKKGHQAHAAGQTSVALSHWRGAGRVVRNTDVLRKLFDQLAPLYMERNGGYTRIIRLDHMRVGDNARLVLLELVDTEKTKKPLVRGVAAPTPDAAAGGDVKPDKDRATKPKKEKKAARPRTARDKKESKTAEKPSKKAGKSTAASKGKTKSNTKAKRSGD
ncbi:MAG TPA: 50S ribosomal protein L17 [Candidatus Krumholzibacteria bacterium]|nr:50S ribosomal protein L17 [Candidatus Krumholzibacteria bacterium]